jgi:hypothetical protein
MEPCRDIDDTEPSALNGRLWHWHWHWQQLMEFTMNKFKNWFRSTPQSSGGQPAQDPPPAATASRAPVPAPATTQKDKYGHFGEVNSFSAKKLRKEVDAKLNRDRLTPGSENITLVSSGKDKERKFKANIQPERKNPRRAFTPTLETIQEHEDTQQWSHESRTPDLPTDLPKPSPSASQDPPEVINGVVTRE